MPLKHTNSLGECRVLLNYILWRTEYGPNRVEKYRPLQLDDIVGNTETIDRLKVISKDGNCPHIIISVSRVLPSPMFHFSVEYWLLKGDAWHWQDDQHPLPRPRPTRQRL